ncbi:NEK kinase [Pyrenophora seminiperda CCB06]|uniref:NEK kinase n=1 Tax=Pyrenophora seminiperda CCB06 TaxID=1302712 RepID=A0A3M7M825_9PLEO|nr:NEK kinase [Pyrenophora seminiperda CCB06]
MLQLAQLPWSKNPRIAQAYHTSSGHLSNGVPRIDQHGHQASLPCHLAGNIKWTAETLWFGEIIMRDEYKNKVGKKKTYPLYRPDLVPVNPWNQDDAISAKNNRRLPLPRNIMSIVRLLPTPLTPAVSPSPPPPPTPPPAPPPPLPARPRNAYPFDFWPDTPWDADPEGDASLGEPLKHIKEDAATRRLWRNTRPMMWPDQNEDDWENRRYLGAGTFGFAGLWCQQDETDTIIKQMVVKESRPRKDTWRDPLMWRGQLPREIKMHQLVDRSRTAAGEGTDHNTLIEHQGYRLMMNQQRYRIFLNYYEGSDLSKALIKHFRTTYNWYHKSLPGHRKWVSNRSEGSESSSNDSEDGEESSSDETENSEESNSSGLEWDAKYYCFRKAPTGGGQAELPELLPQGVIWKITSSLVKACQILHYGQVSQNGVQDTTPGWNPIKHNDIKLNNIFVHPAMKEDEYPTFVLSDLGESFTDLDTNAGGITDNPLQYTFDDIDTRYPPVSDKIVLIFNQDRTNTSGRVMYDLLANGTFHCAAPRRFLPPNKTIACSGSNNSPRNLARRILGGHFLPAEEFPTFLRYPDELKNLTASCLTWESAHRPSLLEMRRVIDAYLTSHPDIANDRSLGPMRVRQERKFRIGKPFGQWKRREKRQERA